MSHLSVFVNLVYFVLAPPLHLALLGGVLDFIPSMAELQSTYLEYCYRALKEALGYANAVRNSNGSTIRPRIIALVSASLF